MKNIQYLTIDINKKTQQPITANVGEVGSRFVRIKITDNNVPIDLTGVDVYLYALKIDKTKVFNIVEIEDATRGVVLAELTSQLLVNPGSIKLTLLLIDGDSRLGSKEFLLYVDGSIFNDSAIESVNEFTALTTSLARVGEWNGYFEETSGQIEQKYTERLNKHDEQFISKANKNEIWSMSNMGQDIKEAMTGGSVAVVDKRGVDNLNATGELYKSYLKSQIINFSNYKFINLFDYATVIEGKYISNLNGKEMINTNYCYSLQISVEQNEKYTASTPNVYIAFFDESGNFISGLVATNKFTTPSNAKYMIISPKISDKTNIVVAKGDLNLNKYYNYLDGEKEVDIDVKINLDNLDNLMTSTQIINFDDLSLNGTMGYLTENGTVKSSESWKTTNFKEIKDITKDFKIIGTSSNRTLCFYDENKNFISYFVSTNFTPPSNAKYLRISIKLVSGEFENIMLTQDDNATTVESYRKAFLKKYIPKIDKTMLGEDVFSSYNLKIQLFGDSITDNTWGRLTWVDYIQDSIKTNSTILNNAIGGSKLSKDNSATNSIVELIKDGSTLKLDNDIIVVFAGTNDWSKNQQIGDFLSDDETTINGSVKKIIEHISTNTKSILLFVTPLKRNHTSDSDKSVNEQGLKINENVVTLNDVCDAIIKTCEWYGVPYIDMNKLSGINEINATKFMSDGLHPIGGKLEKRIANIICNEIKKYF